MDKQTNIRQAIITFLECEIIGEWTKESEWYGEGSNPWGKLRNWREGASIRLVRPDEMIREFSFKNESVVFIGSNSIRFNQEDVKDEHSVDQDIQDGKRANAKVVKPTDE